MYESGYRAKNIRSLFLRLRKVWKALTIRAIKQYSSWNGAVSKWKGEVPSFSKGFGKANPTRQRYHSGPGEGKLLKSNYGSSFFRERRCCCKLSHYLLVNTDNQPLLTITQDNANHPKHATTSQKLEYGVGMVTLFGGEIDFKHT